MSSSWHKPAIPLFDQTPHHSFVPTEVRTAVARSGGPGRPLGRRDSALPWTVASTMAGWHRVGRTVSLVTLIASFCLSAAMPAFAQSSSPSRHFEAVEPAEPFTVLIDEASQRFGVPTLWVRLVIQVESAGDARAVSSKGAMGLMQIMPETYARLHQSYGLGTDPFQPRDNIMAGTAYLREMYDRYGAPGFLAAYNAGPGRYEDHLATGRPLPEETRLYLARLAPLIAGVQAERIATAPDPLAWTRAPLFIVRAGNSKDDHTPQAVDRSSDQSAAGHDVADVTALEPQSDGLFVRVPSGARPQ